MKQDHIEIFKFLLETKPSLLWRKISSTDHKHDLMYYATKFSSFNIIRYLESLSIQWNYLDALRISPLTNNLEIFKQTIAKVDPHIMDLECKHLTNTINFHIFKVTPKYHPLQTIFNAIKVGSIEILDYYQEYTKLDMNHILNSISVSLLPFLMKYGNTQIFERYFPDFGNLIGIKLDELAENNKLDLIKYFINEKKVNGHCSLNSLIFAAYNGNIEMFKWFLDLQINPTNVHFSIDVLSRNGHLNMIKWIHMNRPIQSLKCTTNAMDKAAKYGHIELLKWLHENRTEGCSVRAILGSIRKKQRETTMWLIENRSQSCISVKAYHTAANYGHLELLKKIYSTTIQSKEFKPDLHMKAMEISAKNGHINIVEWLSQFINDSLVISNCIEVAMSNDHFNIAKWLFNRYSTTINKNHDNNKDTIIVSNNAMNYASQYGDLDGVIWLHNLMGENSLSIKMNSDSMDIAASNGRMDVVKWLHFNRSEGCTTNAMDNAAANGFLDVVEWLHNNRSEGCTTRAMNNAATNGYIDVVKWLHFNRTEGCTELAIDSSVRGNGNVIRFLLENRTEGFTEYGLINSVSYGDFEIVQILYNHLGVKNNNKSIYYKSIDIALQNSYFNILKYLNESFKIAKLEQ